jgi:hypothetical protein
MCDLIKELNHLNTNSKLVEGETRSLSVTLRALIADQPARAWLKNCKGHNGYYACERCKIVGCSISVQEETQETDPVTKVKICKTVKKKGIKYANSYKEPVPDLPRCTEEWASYLDIEPGESMPNMKHRLGPTPLDNLIDFDPIRQIPLEEMHLIDGGGLKSCIKTVLRITKNTAFMNTKMRKGKKTNTAAKGKKKRLTIFSKKDLRSWNCRISVWSRSCSPYEFHRTCRTLITFKIWKMAEYRQFMLYYMIPLMYLDKMGFDALEASHIHKFLKAYSLITGTAYKPVPACELAQARKYMAEFFAGITEVSKAWCTLKVHNMWKHICDDAEYFKCRTTALSAYPFENEVSFFRKVSYFSTCHLIFHTLTY